MCSTTASLRLLQVSYSSQHTLWCAVYVARSLSVELGAELMKYFYVVRAVVFGQISVRVSLVFA